MPCAGCRHAATVGTSQLEPKLASSAVAAVAAAPPLPPPASSVPPRSNRYAPALTGTYRPGLVRLRLHSYIHIKPRPGARKMPKKKGNRRQSPKTQSPQTQAEPARKPAHKRSPEPKLKPEPEPELKPGSSLYLYRPDLKERLAKAKTLMSKASQEERTPEMRAQVALEALQHMTSVLRETRPSGEDAALAELRKAVAAAEGEENGEDRKREAGNAAPPAREDKGDSARKQQRRKKGQKKKKSKSKKAVTAAAVPKAGPSAEEPKMLSPDTLRLNLDLDLAQTDMAHGHSGVLQEPMPGMAPPSVSDPSWEWLRVRDP